jgi:type I restriction enzyme, S subunit
MRMEIQEFPKAFAVWFKDLDRWDVSSFHQISWHWQKEVMAPLGSVLDVRKEKIDRLKVEFSELQPITIHFDGSIDPRKMDSNREYTMDLFYAYEGDIVVSKIDLKNGAVGIVPNGLQNVAVTNHFAVYKPDLDKILPGYFQLIIQSKFFKAHLWRNKVGAEGRKEVKIGFFEALEIPIPPIAIQQAIVNHYQTAQTEIKGAYEKIEKLKASINERFFQDLGLKPSTLNEYPKVFAVWWKDFLRWSVSYNQANQSGEDITQGVYPVIELDSILKSIQYGTSVKANITEQGIPIIRMNNLVDGFLDASKLKHIQLTDKEQKSLLLNYGDILFNRTNSKDLVGKCAVFDLDGDYVFASYLIRLKVDESKAIPEFITYVINSRIGRQQIDSLSRQIIGQANINSEEIRSLQIPLPPIKTQIDIMSRSKEGHKTISYEREKAESKKMEIEAEIEVLILGTKKIEEFL